MPKFQESGFEFDLPDGRYFQFQNCRTYVTKLGTASVKEMDFAWVKSDQQLLWLMEVKFFSHQGATHFDRVKETRRLQKKITDALMMIAAIWAGTQSGSDLLRDIQSTCPNFPVNPVALKPILAIGIDRTDAAMLLQGPITTIRNNLKGLGNLMGFSNIGFILLNKSESLTRPIPINPI